MAIDFTSATGNLFNRLGRIFGAILNIEQFQSAAIPNLTKCVSDEFNGDRDYIPNLQNSSVGGKGGLDGLKAELFDEAETTLVNMVRADTPQNTETLDLALPELIAQMETASASVDACNTTVAVAADASNNGNGRCVASITDGKGTVLENIFDERVVVKCKSDSQPETGQTAVGSELFAAEGEAARNLTAHEWPGGSEGSTAVAVSNPAEDATAANLLTNGDFEAFTSNAPDSWTIVTGTAASTVDETATAYVGSKALSLIGTAAAERTRIGQSLRAAPGTAGTVTAQRRYAVGVWVRVSAVPAAGTLRISLRDGTADGATVIGGRSITVDLTAESTSYAFHSAQFNTPEALPDNLHVVVELTVAIDNGKSVYIDQLAMTEMVRHRDGVLVAIFPGNTKFIVGDQFNITMTNNRAGLFQEFFARAFGMSDRRLQLPSDAYGAETINDSLISC